MDLCVDFCREWLMKTVVRTKLFLLVVAAVFVGAGSVAVAQDQESPDDAEVEEAEELAQQEADEQPAEQDDPADEDEEDGDEADEEGEETADDEDDEAEEVADEEEPADEDEPRDDLEDDVAPEDDEADEQQEEVADEEDEETDEEEPWDDLEEEAEQEAAEQQEEAEQEVAEQEEAEEEAEEEQEEAEEDPFSPTIGVGLDTGLFFTSLTRFNDYILEPNDRDTFGVLGTQNLDLSVESEVVENFRVAILGGTTFAWQRDPSLFGWYVGLEPAYVAGDDEWGLGVGLSGAVGGLRITTEDDDRVAMSLARMRMFVEVRRYFSENLAAQVRGGWNHWWPSNPRSDELDLEAPHRADTTLDATDLETGGPFLSVGVRFGALQGLEDPDEMEPPEEPEDDE